MNLLFVMCDEMREMAMGVAGDPNVRTPNMDRLAYEGVRMTRAFTPSPVCSPARASIHTGLYPHNAGMGYRNNNHLREDAPTLAEHLRANGYDTGHIGKWHLNGKALTIDKRCVPPEHHRGFDYWSGYEHGELYYDLPYYEASREPIQPAPGQYEPDLQTDKAIAFIKGHRGDKWYLDLSWSPPHFPLTADNVPPEFLARYDPSSIVLRDNVPEAQQVEAREMLAVYYAMIENLDTNLGRLLDVLGETEQENSTVVVFTSDHGDMLLSHGWHYKRRIHEESLRVPFLIRCPGVVPAGRTLDGLASLVDTVPSLLDLLCLPPLETEGVSLAPYWLGQSPDTPRDAVFAGCAWLGCREYGGRHFKSPWRGVRTERYACTFLKVDDTAQCVELYDLDDDPLEYDNLAVAPASLEALPLLNEVRSLLSAHLKETNDTDFLELKLVVPGESAWTGFPG